jgi:YD repeat-containing protein
MATIIGGNGTGTLDSSLYLLNRSDTAGAGTAGHGEQVYIDVSNGNLVLSQLDEFLPSETNNFLTLRTYNSRGQFGTPDGEGWLHSEFSRLSVITPGQIVVLNGDGSQFTFNYDSSARLYRSVDGAGAYETISFDVRTGTYSLVQSNQTVLTYDFTGRLLQSKDTNGNTVTYSYDLFGHLSSISDNSGHRLDFIYQFGGQLARIQDETGAVLATYSYLGNRLVSVTDRAGATTSYSYYLDGTLRSVTLPWKAGETQRTLFFTYAAGPGGPLISSFTDALGNVTRFNYNFNFDLFGRILGGTTSVTDALGRVTAYTFDAKGQITKVRDSQGLDTVYGYDANENLTSVIDADGSAIIKSDAAYYRNLRRDFGIVEPAGQGKLVSELTSGDITALQVHFTTRLTYDANGNLTSRTDASGNVTSYTYTSFNKVASTASGNGNTTVYTYDAKQNLTQVQAANGDLTRLTYDSFGNLLTKTVYLDPSNLTDPSKQEKTQYFYDAFGNNIKTIDPQGNTTLSTFDHFGNRLTQVDGNGGVTTYTYDAENQLTSTTDPLGNTTLNFYDSVGNRIAVRDASGHTVTYLYNADNLLITVIDPSAGSSQASRTTRYSYDVVGNRTSTTDAEGRVTSYTYDALNRELTVTSPQVTNAAGNSISYTTSYSYDGVGNRITIIDNNGNRTDTVYNSNNLVRRIADASGHISEYAYDADLNQVSIVIGAELGATARQVVRFSYDQKDRLLSGTDALGNKQSYTYDGADNRISATDANGGTTNYTYDRDNRLLIETKPAVVDPATGQPVRYTIQHQYDANGNQVAVTDQDGHTVRTTFDKDNRGVLVQDANGIQTVYTYDSRGNRTSVQVGVQAHVDSTGHVVVDSAQNAQVETYSYDEFNQVVSKTDGVGNALISSDSALYIQLRQQLGVVDGTGQGKHVAQLTAADIQNLKAQFTERYTYDRVGNDTSTTDHLGRTTSFTFDGLNRVVKTTDALGQQTTTIYDGDGNVVATKDALGRQKTNTYDARNRLVDTTDALGVVTHRSYDTFGNITASTVASGTSDARTTRYVYDLDNRLVSNTDPQGNTQTYSYDAVGNRLQVTDGKGQATRYVYDALNKNIAVIDPLGFQTRIVYDGVGNRLSLIDAKGGITQFIYDAGNREIQMQDAEGRVTTYAYDVLGNRISQTTAAGTPEQETTAYLYDAENHLRQVTDATGHVSSTGYDAVYNRVRGTDANGNATSYAFDALNREIQVTDATGKVTRYAYDAVGNRLSVTDGNGHVTTYAYDARNQLIRSTDANGVDATYAYDAVGNQVRITHAANTSVAAISTFTYNSDDNLVSQTDALGNTQTNEYDANNNVVAVTDALGHKTTYVYDADNRVTSITDPLGNVTQYRYDANGNRVQVVDARGFVSTKYYNADSEVVLAIDNNGYATSYLYDHNGNAVSQTLYAIPLTGPLDPAVRPSPTANGADRTTTFTYDPLNRIATRTDGEGFVTQYAYDAVGNTIQTRQALDRAGAQFEVTRSYYDAVNRQIAKLSAQGYLTTYQYDAVGNRIAQTQYDQIVSAPANGSVPAPVAGDSGHTTRFAYDAADRQIQETDALGVITTYQYDARNNRISMIEAAGTADARTTTYRYDAADRYVETTNALGVVTHLDLDANGNVHVRHEAYGTAQERVSTFTYDANNRVVSESDALGVVTQTTYDADGNVLTRTFAAGTTDARSSGFTYDGEAHQLTSTDAAAVTTTYVYDAAGNQIQVTQAAGTAEARTNSFVYDRANRQVSATDALGTVTKYQYDGAGNKITTIQAAGTPQERHTSYGYDLDDRLARVTDPLGGVTRYQYDVLGNQTQIIDANGGVQVNTFDAVGHALSSLSSGGVLIRNSYDLRGNIISTTQSFANGSDARTSTDGYDLLNRQVLVTDGEGFSTSISYDAFGNQIGITHGQYLVSQSDPSYSAAKAARAFPQTNTFSYDADDRMLSFTDALGNVTSYQYDTVGNRISSTDANGHTTRYTYDLLNRVTETTTPEGGITRDTYDHVGNKIAEDQLQSGDAATGVWRHSSFQYDANGYLTAETDPTGVATTYSYDAMGNLLSQTSAAGTSDARTVRMEYDLDNRKITDIDALGNRTTYAYDAMGNRIKVTDALGHVARYYYDGANQLKEVVDPQGFVNTFAYDAAGNRVQARVYLTPLTGAIDDHSAPVPTGNGQDRITSQQYDRANRLIAQTAPDGSVTQYAYDGAGNKVTEIRFANTSAPRTVQFAYDADNRLLAFTDVDGSVTTFTYDRANNKLSQTITSTTDPNHARTTTYAYDANNREVSETFDPSGLAITQSFSYDHLGNMLAKTDGKSHTTTFAYDLNNRQVSQTDPLGNTARFTYDRVGNKTSATDARGNATDYVYDAANHLLQEIQPSVQVYTVSGGFTTLRPVITHVYDANGNEVQTTDPNGGITTRYFDGDNRLIALISADNALTAFTYDAAGDKISQTMYMTRLDETAQDPSVLPQAPAGASRLMTYSYDVMGRLTQTTYPPAQITALVNADTGNPSSVTVNQQVTERNVYDAFGNLVASFDRNGNRTLNYYDVKGQKVATVDALGYLTEWDYDQQGNTLEQRLYTQPLNPATLSPGTRPTPPGGPVSVTDIQYDAASRKVQEIAAQISVFDPTTQTTRVVRPTTTYTYDKVGNQLTKTLGAGTSQAVTEYSYYDASNRRVAVISSGRVLSTYAYDANGNVLAQKRYFNPVAAGVDLSQLTGSTDFSSLIGSDGSHDEESDFTYDALDRQTRAVDILSSGSLTKTFASDAIGNRTYTQDEDGYITQASYDGVGRIVQSISPDGSGTQYQYDAAGNRILIYTGVLTGGAPTPATDVSATLGSQVKLSWSTQGSNQHPLQTWIVYDTVSHQNLSDYASRTATAVSSNGKGQAALNSSGTGAIVYFRVVTQDGAGNETWTAEQSITVPPRFTAVSVAQPDSNTIVVTAHFDSGAASPQLAYGTGTNLSQTAAFVLQGDGSYQATLSGVSNPGALSFALQWQDGAGNHYSSSTSTFAAAADQVGISSTVTQSQTVNGGNTSYSLSVSTHVPSAYASGLTALQAQWRLAGSSSAFAATAVAGTTSGQGYEIYNAVLGDASSLAAGAYEIVLTGVRADGTSVELDHFTFEVGPTATSVTRNAVSWIAPAVGNDQLVIIDGQNAPASRDGGRIVVTDGSTAPSTDYAAFYGQDSTETHTVNVSSTAQTQTVTDPNKPNDPPQVVTTGYNVAVQTALTAAEAANVGSGGLHLAWRPAGSGTAFANDVVLASSGANTFATTLGNIPAGQYDLKLYYLDNQGNQVVVEWRRIDAATVSNTYTGHSLTVLAQESGGTIATDAQGVVTLAPGVYTGALDVNALSSSLALRLDATGNAGGSLKTDGRATGYFTELQYNSLDYKIASNEGDGLWRQYGVDANGNTVQTDLLGDRSSPDYNPANAITTYTAFDARNRKIAVFGAQVGVPGGGVARPVDRYEYDVLNDTTAHTDALGNTTRYVFNALGTQVEQIDPYGAITESRIDQFGNVTATVSPVGGHTSLKFYDLQGRLIKERDPMGNETTYTYDAFDRKLAQTDALGHTTSYTYDQRDRITSQTDAAGNSESFVYDGRNNRTSTLYPLGQRTDVVYDSLGRVIDDVLYLNGRPTHSQGAYDAYGNLISETDAMGRTKTHLYGAFGRLLEDIDEDGNVITYNYDVYGRRTNEYDSNAVSDPNAASDPSGGKDIQKTYNDAGQVTSIRDLATGVSTTYTYDLLGHRVTEVITTPGNAHNRNISYEYDALGQMVRWKDSVTGDNLNKWYDSEGNVVREFTDAGYDPLSQNSGANPNYRYEDHWYTYDADRRVMKEVQRTTDASGNFTDTILNEYTYDAASNRLTWNNQGILVTYTYDAIDRATEGDYFTGSDSNRQVWTYDALGNVVTYTTFKNGSQQSSTVNTYNDANRTVTSNKDGEITTNTFDTSLRITQTVLQNKDKTYYYNYSYYGDGREKSVQAFGDAKGNSASAYDANKIRVRVDLGQGDGQDRPEFKTFIADNEGHILYEFRDDGKSSIRETHEYLYANGAPAGENTIGTDGKLIVQLDSGTYTPIQNLSDSNPGSNLTYTVQSGDTLQGIASQMYGNASLWFVIADANGLSAGEALKAGTTLLIPNTVKSGTITADNHKVYSESEIVGSTLPNLKSPPPPHHGGCGSILAIIIVVVIAIVAVIATAGLAGAFLGAAAATASTATTIAAYAVAGVIVGAVASVVQQGLFIALGYQSKFSWKQVAAGAVAGGFAGAAAGVGQAAQLLAQAGKLTQVGAAYAKVAEAALDVAKVASQDLIENGKITSWTGLAAAAVSGYAQGASSIAKGAQASGALNAAQKGVFAAAAESASNFATVTNYVTPWVQLAETYVRNDGKLAPTDWANAVGSTLADAVSNKFGAQGNSLSANLTNASLRLGSKALVAGALSAYSKNDAEQYLDDSIGQEVGTLIGNTIVGSIEKAHERNKLKNALDGAGVEYTLDSHGNPQAVATHRASFDFVTGALSSGATVQDIKDGVAVLGGSLSTLDQAPGTLEQSVVNARVANALKPAPIEPSPEDLAPVTPTAAEQQNNVADQNTTSNESTDKISTTILPEVVVTARSEGPSGSSIIGKTVSGGAELLTGAAELYANHPVLATALYGGVKAVLSGGPIKSVALQLAKLAEGALLSEATNYIVNLAQTSAEQVVTDFAEGRHLSLDLSFGSHDIQVGPKDFGQVAGVFAGGVVQTVLDGTIKNVADRGGQVNGIVEKAEQRTEQEIQQAASEAARVEASVARALKGDSQALKKSLEAAGQEVPKDYAAHHLIPSHLVDEHADMFEAAAKNGFSINAAENGWALPRTKELAKELELPLHSGNHLDSYYDAASSELNALQEAYRAGKVTSSQLPGRLNEISATMKQKLQDLELFLQTTDPRYPK